MTVLTSDVDATSEIYLKTERSSPPRSPPSTSSSSSCRRWWRALRSRHHDRGRLLARERIELLVDRDAPFLELSSLAAWGTQFTVGASIVTGVGVVSGVECVIIAHDPTVRGGTMNPYTLRKNLRALDIARATGSRSSTWSSPAAPTCRPSRSCSSHAGKIFQDLTELSGDGHPDRRAGVRQLHRRRRLRARHVRLRRPGRQAGQGLPRRPAAGQDGHRRGRRRRGARRRRHALPRLRVWATTSPSTRSTAIRIGRADRRRPQLAQARARADAARRRAALRCRGTARHRRRPTSACRSIRAR